MTEGQEIQQLLLKMNSSLVLLRKVQNMVISAVVELNNHTRDLNAHEDLAKQFQLGIDKENVNKMKTETERVLLKFTELENRTNKLADRLFKLEGKVSANNNS